MLDRFRFISVPWLVRWTPILILLLAAYWRFENLPGQSFWNDEGNTLRLIQRNLNDMLDRVSQDIHPPGYYILLKGWSALAGENEFGLRSFSAFWGLLAVAFTYALGARLYARAAGIMAMLLVAINPLAVYYSQEARMYAQLGALSVISMWLLAVIVTQPRRLIPACVGLALVNTVGLYTQYTYPFTMLVQGILFLWWWIRYVQAFRLRPLMIFAAANFITLVLFLPWLPTAVDQITTWPTFDSGVALSEKSNTVLTYITFGNSASGLGVLDFLWVGVIFLTVFLPDWYRKPPSNRWRVALPLAWMGVICGALFYSGAYREANLKFLLPAQIGMALVLGRGIYLLWDAGSGSAAVPLEMLPRFVAGVACFFILTNTYGWLDELRTNPAFQRHDYRAIAAFIEQNSDSGDAVILNAPGQIDVFSYYFDGSAAVFPLPRGLGGDDAATRAETLDILANYRRVFVVFWGEGERDPHSIVKNTLDDNAFEISSRWYGDVRLAQYGVLEPPPTEPTVALNTLFGEHITLEGYAISGEVAPGNVIGVTLFWHTDEVLEARYKIFVQLLNNDGVLVSQHDAEPANNRAMTTQWQPGERIVDNHGILIPLDAAPGDYIIIVGVYDLSAPENRLPVQEGDSLILERVTIE